MKFTHIYQDDIGVVRFDRYFQYIDQIKSSMPPELAGFASDTARYQLTGPRTLHDARLKSLNVEHRFDGNAITFASVTLNLLLASQECLVLKYVGASGIIFLSDPVRWPDKAVDLLIHEFLVEHNNLFSHLIEFDRGVWLKVTFSDLRLQQHAA